MIGSSYIRNFGSRGKLQNLNEISDTLVAAMGTGGGNVPIITEGENMDNLRIRKLTPKECWRLMGFNDSDFDKASKVNSNAQLYKQAGNSIVVNVLEAILYNLIVNPSTKEENIIEGQTNIYDFINE
jgi:site-specific DNA-cytosine methylase